MFCIWKTEELEDELMDDEDDIQAPHFNKLNRNDPLSLSTLTYKLPAFLKGQSHAVPGEKQRRSEGKKKRNQKFFSPIPFKGGPSSVISVPIELPNDLDKFYKNLSGGSGSDEDLTDNLDKLKSLFRGSNLGK